MSKAPNKFSKDWGSLYDIRNKVAHGKPINKADFKKANELIELFTTAFDECIEIIDTLEMTVEEAEAVEAVAQQVVMQNEQPDTFERENFSARIKSYPYSVKLNSEALSGGLKITGCNQSNWLFFGFRFCFKYGKYFKQCIWKFDRYKRSYYWCAGSYTNIICNGKK